jgi:hypothetical protein
MSNPPHNELDPQLRQAFEETDYIVHHQPPFVLRIGQRSPELDALLRKQGQDCAAFITAWNPMCQRLAPAENHARQQALLAELQRRSLEAIPGIGQHPENGWPGEESCLVLGLSEQAANALCSRFEQKAFVACRRGEAPRLVSC